MLTGPARQLPSRRSRASRVCQPRSCRSILLRAHCPNTASWAQVCLMGSGLPHGLRPASWPQACLMGSSLPHGLRPGPCVKPYYVQYIVNDFIWNAIDIDIIVTKHIGMAQSGARSTTPARRRRRRTAARPTRQACPMVRPPLSQQEPLQAQQKLPVSAGTPYLSGNPVAQVGSPVAAGSPCRSRNSMQIW